MFEAMPASTKTSYQNRRIDPMAGRQSGLTLIEVMVALLVLSIGLIGISVLHLNAIKFAHSSYYSSVASSAALDLEERLWLQVRETNGNCVSAAQVNTAVAEVLDQWGGTAPGGITIPGLAINVGNVTVGTTQYSWTEVPVTLTWTDNRFSTDADTNLIEQFNYTARVVCFL
jgi:type IV pilus assembly protein PilV